MSDDGKVQCVVCKQWKKPRQFIKGVRVCLSCNTRLNNQRKKGRGHG